MTAAITMGGETTVARIDAVDAFARNLYMRLRQSPNAGDDPPLDEVAVAVKQLHLALRHLRVEATDPDSLLNRAASTSLYVRQLEPLVEDCSFQLRQLDTALATIDIQGSARAERLASLRTKLANEKMSVDMFLDTVQLHDPSKQPAGIIDGSQTGLENIKDKVDAIAAKLFTRRGDDFMDDEDRLWQEFKSELEKEGFSPQVLRRHKEVLRAYIRELETMSQQNGGAPPTVRGLLEHEAKTQPPSSKEMYPTFENEKFPTSMHNTRRTPNVAPLIHQNPPLPPRHMPYPEPRTSISSEDSTHSDGGDSMALISTRDLVAIDHLSNGMANMHLQAPNQYYGSSPNQRLLGSSAPSSFSTIAELAGSPGSNALSASPASTALPPYNSPQLPPYSSQRPSFRLAPDRYGNEIPMDAPWTKVRGRLISQEVLNRHGRRFEARPDYIAILGRLSREEIAEYVRESVECRAARSRKYGNRSFDHPREKRRGRADSKSSRDDDGSLSSGESDTTDLNDDKTSPKGTKSYPYIVNFPDKEKETASPAATVQPKSILKNKNENHVRFDFDEPYEVEPRSGRSPPKGDRDRRSKRYHDEDYRDDDRSRRHRREPDGRPRRRSLEDRDRRRSDHREREQDRDRARDRGHRDREYRDREYRDRDRERGERDRYRDEDRKDDKSSKKKAWGETLGAVGIGGAAVSLLGVLAEAATGI